MTLKRSNDGEASVLDTNVFLLLIVGLADTRYIASHDNTRAFDLEEAAGPEQP